MKFTKTSMLLVYCMAALSSCKKETGNLVIHEINVTDFDKATAADDHEITITAGNAFRMQARGDIADVNELRAAIAGKNLTIEYPAYRNGRKRVHSNITMPTIKMLDFGGSCYGKVHDFNSADTMKVSISGEAAFTVSGDIALFDVNTAGTSALLLNGTVKKQVADVSGQANYAGYGLKNTNTALVWASGQANAYVYSENQLTADASGKSHIFYRGNPVLKEFITSGEAMITGQ